MGIRTGYQVRRHDAPQLGIVAETYTFPDGGEPAIATVAWPEGETRELLRDLVSVPPRDATPKTTTGARETRSPYH